MPYNDKGSWMKFVLGIILSTILLMSGLGYDVNYAEARGDDEPCSYSLPHSFLKISNDPWHCEKVDYWVLEICGIKAGLYKTNTSCQPPVPTTPTVDPNSALGQAYELSKSSEDVEQKKAEVDAYCKSNPGKCVSDFRQESRDSTFTGITAGIIIAILIGIGILFARKKLHGSFGGGSGGYDDVDYDDDGYDDDR